MTKHRRYYPLSLRRVSCFSNKQPHSEKNGIESFLYLFPFVYSVFQVCFSCIYLRDRWSLGGGHVRHCLPYASLYMPPGKISAFNLLERSAGRLSLANVRNWFDTFSLLLWFYFFYFIILIYGNDMQAKGCVTSCRKLAYLHRICGNRQGNEVLEGKACIRTKLKIV